MENLIKILNRLRTWEWIWKIEISRSEGTDQVQQIALQGLSYTRPSCRPNIKRLNSNDWAVSAMLILKPSKLILAVTIHSTKPKALMRLTANWQLSLILPWTKQISTLESPITLVQSIRTSILTRRLRSLLRDLLVRERHRSWAHGGSIKRKRILVAALSWTSSECCTMTWIQCSAIYWVVWRSSLASQKISRQIPTS